MWLQLQADADLKLAESCGISYLRTVRTSAKYEGYVVPRNCHSLFLYTTKISRKQNNRLDFGVVPPKMGVVLTFLVASFHKQSKNMKYIWAAILNSFCRAHELVSENKSCSDLKKVVFYTRRWTLMPHLDGLQWPWVRDRWPPESNQVISRS